VNKLPSTWVSARLGEAAHIEMGQSPDSKFYNDHGKGLPFFQGKADFGPLYPTARKWCSQPTKVAEAGDILLSVRAPVGPTNLANEQCCIGRGLSAIRATEPISQKYLLHFLRHIEPWLAEQGTGSTFAAISGSFLREIPILIAPSGEQRRIAKKLDSILARVSECQSRLNNVPDILNQFRQSVVSSAVSGRLSEDYRSQVLTNATLVPTNTTLADLCTKTRVITYGVIKLGSEIAKGVPCLRTSNVRWLRITTIGMKRISKRLSAEYPRTVLQGSEVLVNVRGTLGGVAVATPAMRGWNVSREVAVVPVDKAKAVPEFLALWIASERSQRWLRNVEKGVAYVGINIEDLRALPVELPTIQEQREIVRRVNSLFAYANRIETLYTNARSRVHNLTPAVLAKAFRGELVSQDPNDESGAALLEHLQSVRADAITNATKGKPRMRKQPLKQSESSKPGDIVQALRKAGKPLSSNALLLAAGYPHDSDSESIEEFIVQLRGLLKRGVVAKQRLGNEDLFRLTE